MHCLNEDPQAGSIVLPVCGHGSLITPAVCCMLEVALCRVCQDTVEHLMKVDLAHLIIIGLGCVVNVICDKLLKFSCVSPVFLCR